MLYIQLHKWVTLLWGFWVIRLSIWLTLTCFYLGELVFAPSALRLIYNLCYTLWLPLTQPTKCDTIITVDKVVGYKMMALVGGFELWQRATDNYCILGWCFFWDCAIVSKSDLLLFLRYGGGFLLFCWELTRLVYNGAFHRNDLLSRFHLLSVFFLWPWEFDSVVDWSKSWFSKSKQVA